MTSKPTTRSLPSWIATVFLAVTTFTNITPRAQAQDVVVSIKLFFAIAPTTGVAGGDIVSSNMVQGIMGNTSFDFVPAGTCVPLSNTMSFSGPPLTGFALRFGAEITSSVPTTLNQVRRVQGHSDSRMSTNYLSGGSFNPGKMIGYLFGPSGTTNDGTCLTSGSTDTTLANQWVGIVGGVTTRLSSDDPATIAYQTELFKMLHGDSQDYVLQLSLNGIIAQSSVRITTVPILKYSRLQNAVVLSWRTNSSDLLLQTNGSLSATDWATLTTNYFMLSDNYVVTNAASSGQLFYRLKSR